MEQLRAKREGWVKANRENGFEEGILNLLTELYPDNAHFLYELLQNAEDAGARNVRFSLHPDRLECSHDGNRLFSAVDVESITSIGNSAKRQDINKIGKFGVGFKAVFAYTGTPKVYSGDFAFEIRDLVVPVSIDRTTTDVQTRFVFPFNAGRKSPAQAFDQISKGLLTLADTTLLFLHNIEEISWQIDGKENGYITRLPHSESHIEIERTDGKNKSSSHFLRFSAPSTACEGRNVAMAYQLAFREEGQSLFKTGIVLPQQMKIIPAEGSVCIYFPADKETSKLRFHLHAPFASTVARDSVQDRPENEELLGELASLACASLHSIRDLGLLSTEFLEVLPLEEDGLSAFYTPIREAVVEAMNTQPLTPTFTKTHAPANELLYGPRDLKELLVTEDLHYFASSEEEGVSLQWADSAAQLNSRSDKFLRALAMLEYDMDDFSNWFVYGANTLNSDEIMPLARWLQNKEAAFFQKLYATLYVYFRKESRDFAISQSFSEIPLIRLENGEFATPENCYFTPESGEADDYFTLIPADLYTFGKSDAQKKNARAFLEAAGVREIGEKEQIEHILEAHYAGDDKQPAIKKHLQHMRRFIAFITAHPQERQLFAEFNIFPHEREGKLEWWQPKDIYLDAPYQATHLQALYDTLDFGDDHRFPLSPHYQEDKYVRHKIAEFARTVGVQFKLEVKRSPTRDNPQSAALRFDYSRNDARWTNTAIDEDYTIPNLAEMLESGNLQLLQLVWKTVCEANKTCLESRFRPNQQYTVRKAFSQLVFTLRKYEWVPQTCEDGSVDLVLPGDAVRERLPDTFPYDNQNGWLTAIGFGDTQRKNTEEFQREETILKNMGASRTTLEIAKELESLSIEEQQAILDDIKQRRNPVEMEDRSPANPALRSQRVQEAALEAQEKESEKRMRSISVSNAVIRPTSRQYLKDHYTQSDGTMWCQACQKELPFKLDSGDYYFEAVDLIPQLDHEHDKNAVALCPNHTAMFKHANASREQIAELVQTATGNTIMLTLAGRPVALRFTTTHLRDLQAILAAESEDSENEIAQAAS